MVQESFLRKYCVGWGLIGWRKILLPAATQGLMDGYRTPATRALLQQHTVIARFLRVKVGTEILFLLIYLCGLINSSYFSSAW